MTDKEKMQLFLFLAGLAVLLGVIALVVTLAWKHDTAVLDDFYTKCENQGGVVVAQNRYDRICVTGDIRQIDRLNR